MYHRPPLEAAFYRQTLDALMETAAQHEPLPTWFEVTDPESPDTRPAFAVVRLEDIQPNSGAMAAWYPHVATYSRWPLAEPSAVERMQQPVESAEPARFHPHGNKAYKNPLTVPHVVKHLVEYAGADAVLHTANRVTGWLNEPERSIDPVSRWDMMGALVTRGLSLLRVTDDPDQTFIKVLARLNPEQPASEEARKDVAVLLGKLIRRDFTDYFVTKSNQPLHPVTPEMGERVSPYAARQAALQAEDLDLLPPGFWLPNAIVNKLIYTEPDMLRKVHDILLAEERPFPPDLMLLGSLPKINDYARDLLAQTATEPHRNKAMLEQVLKGTDRMRVSDGLGKLINYANAMSVPLGKQLEMRLPQLSTSLPENVAKALTRILYFTLQSEGVPGFQLQHMYERDMMRVELLELLRLHLQSTPEAPSAIDLRLRDAAASEEEIAAALKAWSRKETPAERLARYRRNRLGGPNTRDRLEVKNAHRPGYGLLS